jgi:signal-transduction protein with cAMP-binding, CBS, and nucleotidyltransferase domain
VAAVLRTKSIFNASVHALISASPHDTLGDIHGKLCDHNSVVILNPDGSFLGIVSRKDAVKAVLHRADWRSIPVQEIMTREVHYVPNHLSLSEAVEIMLTADIHQLVVTGPPEGGGVAVGILTLQDILKNAVP